MYNLENEFKQVENAKKGKYGVYTLEKELVNMMFLYIAQIKRKSYLYGIYN